MAKKTDTATPALPPKLTLHPLDDRIVVQPLDAEEKTAGGILLPQTAQQKPQQGKVVAVGDLVLFGKYSGSDVEVSTVEYKILRESELLGKLV